MTLLDDMVAYLTSPIPAPGTPLTVNGRPGRLVRLEARTTCAMTYVVDHGDGETPYTVWDFGGDSNPTIEIEGHARW